MKPISTSARSTRRLGAAVVLLGLLLVWGRPVAADASEWQWQNPLPQGCNLYAILGFSSTDIFAVGDNGAIVHFDGTDWRSMVSSSGRDQGLGSLWGLTNDDLFAVGWSGRILHYDGAQWRVMDSGAYEYLYSVWGASSDAVFAVGERGTILHYDGNTWERMVSASTAHLSGVWGAAADDVYAVGSDGLVLHYDGDSWTPMPTPTLHHLYDVWGADASDVFAVGAAGTVLRLVDGAWTRVEPFTFEALTEVWGFSGGSVFALEPSNKSIHRFDGSTWDLVHQDTTKAYGIWGVDEDDLYTVGSTGRILHSDGETWTPQTSGNISSGADSYLMSVWGAAADDVFAVGASGRIHHFDGEQWIQQSTPTDEFLAGVWGFSAADVFAVGGYNDDRATILHFDGQVWSLMDPGTESSLRGVWGAASDDVYAVGSDGAIVHYDGASWTLVSSDLGVHLESVWGRSPDDIYAVGAHVELPQGSIRPVVSHFDGVEWQEIEAPGSSWLQSVWGTASGSTFVGNSRGDIFRSTGGEWTYIGRTGYGYSVSAIWGISEQNLYAVSGSNGGNQGSGAIISRFDGSTWRPMVTDPADPLYGVWGTGTGDVFAVGLNTTILHHDEGFAPVIQAVPGSLEFHAVRLGKTSDPLTLRVSNNGTSWLDLGTPSLTGAHADEFQILSDGCSGARLAPSTSCPVEVVFTPVSAGAKDAGVSVTSNDPANPVVSANVIAIGLPVAEAPESVRATLD